MNKTDFIKIANSNQFEINVGYLTNKETKKVDYNISIYTFLPKNLNINESTYTDDDFYNDHISYIRLITPKNNLGILYKKLTALLSSLEDNLEDEKEKEDLSHEIKILVCSYVTFLKSFSKDIEEKKVKPKRIQLFLDRLSKFNDIKKDLLSLHVKSDDEKLTFLLESAAEYISLTAQHHLFKINIYLKSFGSEYNELINIILTLINKELLFCKENSFPIISNDEYQNEKVIFRHSVFKKYFYSVLYLLQNRKEDGTGIKELYYALAAGISMIFTTLVVFATQKEYGNFTTSFFAALVVSYMFKDRIKEAYRHYFDKKIKLKTYDFKEKIYDFEKKALFGLIKERVRFVNKANLPQDVIDARLKKTNSKLSLWYLGEDIIKYEKNITLYNKNIQHYYNNRITGIRNILRFDITKFLKKMDTEKIPLYRINGNSLYGDKVYHVNLIIEFKSQKEKSFHRARLILTKEGIKRIELPEHDIEILREKKFQIEENWFSVKKSGLLRKLDTLKD